MADLEKNLELRRSAEQEALLKKIEAGERQHRNGLGEYQNAKYIGNLTNEVYAQSKPTIFANPGADLNAKSLNQQKLRERLAMTEYYKLRNGGAAHRYWVRAGLERVVARTYAFKFNYAIKALFAYQLLTSYGNYRHIKKHSFMTAEQTVQHGVPVVTCAAALYLACAFI